MSTNGTLLIPTREYLYAPHVSRYLSSPLAAVQENGREWADYDSSGVVLMGRTPTKSNLSLTQAFVFL